MRLFVPGGVSPRKPFAVILYVKASPGQMVTLDLPAGLTLMEGEVSKKPVPPPSAVGCPQMSWRVQALERGTFILQATAPNVGIATEQVRVGVSIGFGE
jgi:hypothetical protein